MCIKPTVTEWYVALPAMLAAMAPMALARANLRARLARVVEASQTRADVIAYASSVTGSSQASRGGHPVMSASPRRPVKLATAADAAAMTIPVITQPSRSGGLASVVDVVTLVAPQRWSSDRKCATPRRAFAMCGPTDAE